MHGWENLRPEDVETILAGIEAGEALGGPYHVELDPIDVCNADCFFCNSVEIRNGAILKWDVLEPRVDEWIAGGLRSVRLAGGGEPLIYPQLPQLLDRLAEADVVLDNVTTNGIRCRDKVLEGMLKTKATNVFFSLNYSNAKRYGEFMRIDPRKFDDIVKNIRTYDAELRRLGKRDETLLHVQFMLHRSTMADIPEMIELAIELPVDTVVFRACGLIPDNEIIRTDEEKAQLRDALEEVGERSRGKLWLEMDLSFVGMQDWANSIVGPLHGAGKPDPTVYYEKPGTIEYCYIGWYSMLVQGTGDVHPCCFLLPDERVPSFGNVNESTVPEIWQGEMYRRHREEMRTVMLMQARTPGQGRRFQCTVERCWGHDDCILSNKLADPGFYQQAHERLEALRKRPATAVARAVNRISRTAIEKGRSIGRS
ncbi:radical SAM protein [bacterium]|nr:radical SAM protein [bacterium]